MQTQPDDPILQRALTRATRSFENACDRWVKQIEQRQDPDDERAGEALDHAREALEHLEGRRWDEACAAVELAIDLAGEIGLATIWRELSILIDEVAAIAQDEAL